MYVCAHMHSLTFSCPPENLAAAIDPPLEHLYA